MLQSPIERCERRCSAMFADSRSTAERRTGLIACHQIIKTNRSGAIKKIVFTYVHSYKTKYQENHGHEKCPPGRSKSTAIGQVAATPLYPVPDRATSRTIPSPFQETADRCQATACAPRQRHLVSGRRLMLADARCDWGGWRIEAAACRPATTSSPTSSRPPSLSPRQRIPVLIGSRAWTSNVFTSIDCNRCSKRSAHYASRKQ